MNNSQMMRRAGDTWTAAGLVSMLVAVLASPWWWLFAAFSAAVAVFAYRMAARWADFPSAAVRNLQNRYRRGQR